MFMIILIMLSLLHNFYAINALYKFIFHCKVCCTKLMQRFACSADIVLQHQDISCSKLCCWGLQEAFNNENTRSDAADEGCTSKTLRAAAAQHGKADSFCFHH